MAKYVKVRAGDFAFVFFLDAGDPRLLHIFARHLVEPKHVFALWYDPATADVWNEEFQRWESSNRTHTLYWNWNRNGDGSVVVYSCFRNDEEAP